MSSVTAGFTNRQRDNMADVQAAGRGRCGWGCLSPDCRRGAALSFRLCQRSVRFIPCGPSEMRALGAKPWQDSSGQVPPVDWRHHAYCGNLDLFSSRASNVRSIAGCRSMGSTLWLAAPVTLQLIGADVNDYSSLGRTLRKFICRVLRGVWQRGLYYTGSDLAGDR